MKYQLRLHIKWSDVSLTISRQVGKAVERPSARPASIARSFTRRARPIVDPLHPHSRRRRLSSSGAARTKRRRSLLECPRSGARRSVFKRRTDFPPASIFDALATVAQNSPTCLCQRRPCVQLCSSEFPPLSRRNFGRYSHCVLWTFVCFLRCKYA